MVPRRRSPATDSPLRVEVPTKEQESLNLGRVGIVAVVGFSIGIIWPWLAKVRLVPSLPESAHEETSKPKASSAAIAAGAAKKGKTKAPAPNEPAPPDPSERLNLGATQVTSCRNSRGHADSKCGDLDVLPVFKTRFEGLASCEGAPSMEGKLSLGFDLDFEKGVVGNLRSGKSTTLRREEAKSLMDCLERELKTVSLADVPHDHPQYTVFHVIEFLPQTQSATEADAGGADSEKEVIAASGRATVSWHVALVRATPRDGPVKERLLSGTQVVVTGRLGDWYRVKFDAKGSEGWVYKGAIGL